MLRPDTLTTSIFVLSVALIVLLIARPALTANRGGKVLAFLGLFLLPVLCSVIGSSAKMEASKQTTFCLSCHIMEPYGKSHDVVHNTAGLGTTKFWQEPH